MRNFLAPGLVACLAMLLGTTTVLAQDRPRFRLVIAADTGSPVLVSFNGEELARSGYRPGFAGRPGKTTLDSFRIAVKSDGASGDSKEINVSSGTLTSVIVFQKVIPGLDGKPAKRELEIVEVVKEADKPKFEVISYSMKPTVRVDINGTTRAYNRGERKALAKLPALKIEDPEIYVGEGPPLKISYDGADLFFESVEAKEHLLIILYDGADGKLRVAVADA